MKQPCKRCEGRAFRYTTPGHNMMKLTVPQLFNLLTKTSCDECEGTGVELPVFHITRLRELQTGGANAS